MRWANMWKETGLPPYEYNGQERELDGVLGEDLKRGRLLTRGGGETDSDRVRILSNGVWYAAYRVASGPGNWQGDAVDQNCRATNSVVFDREPGSDFGVFYPFTNDTVESSYYTVDFPPGWTSTAWPAAYPPSPIADVGLPYETTPGGEPIYPEVWIYRDYHYITIYYSYSRSEWRQGSDPCTLIIQPGEGFYFVNKHATDTVTWTPTIP